MRTKITKLVLLIGTLFGPGLALAADGEGACIKEVYEHERSRGVDHDTALDHAKEVCHEASTASS